MHRIDFPQWSTAERRATLLRLWTEVGNRCPQGHPVCPELSHYLRRLPDGTIEAARPYEARSEALIAGWVERDKLERLALLEQERRQLHGEVGRWKHRFDPVERELFYQNQPEFYLEGVGVNIFTLASQVAKVRLPSSYVRLFIDVGRPTARGSKNARRKLRRYGKVDPVQQASIDAVLTTAVREHKAQ